MDPCLLYSIQRYEKGSEFVIHHLATEARKTNKVEHLFTANIVNGGRKPKKDKKHGKTEEKVYLFSVSQWKELAAAIRDYGGPIPRDFLVILQDTNRLRKECTEWCEFWQHGTEEEDATHKFFSIVLDDIFEMLKPKCLDWKRPTTMPASTNSKTASTNCFEHLKVEELPDIPDVPAWITRPSGRGKVKVSYRPKYTMRDIILSIFLFLKVSNAIVSNARKQCQRFKKEEITLPTFAESLNAAIHLLRKLNSEFDEQMKRHKKIVQHPNNFLRHSDILEFLETSKAKSSAKSRDPLNLYKRTTQILEQLFIKPLPEIDKEILGEPLMLLEHPDLALTHQEKMLTYAVACLLGMTKLHEVPTKNGSLAFNQEAEHGTHLLNLLPTAMIHMRLHNSVPTWIVCSLQMVANVQEELDDSHLTQAFLEMHNTADWIGAELDALLSNGPDLIGRREIKQFREELSKARSELDYASLLGEDANLSATKSLPDPKDRSLYRILPLMSGTKIQKWLQQYHELGMSFSSASEAPLNVAHLYNAVKQDGKLPVATRWTDVDYIIKQQGEAHLFVGGRATEREDVRSRHELARGLSVVTAVSDGRASGQQRMGNKRVFKPMALYSEVAFKVKKGKVHSTRAAGNVGARVEQVVKLFLERRGITASAQKLAALQMLEVYEKALEEDEFSLRFDSLSASISYMALLRDVRDTCKTEAPEVYREDLFREDEEVSNFLSAIFSMPYTDNPDGTAWTKVCAVLCKFIDEHGDDESNKAKSRLHPKIMKP